MRVLVILIGIACLIAFTALPPGPHKGIWVFILAGLALIVAGLFPSVFRAMWRQK